MNVILLFFEGLLLGFGAIMPGISSSVLCIIFGIYDKLVNSILTFFKDFKNNFKFLFPIILGILLGVFLFSNVLKYFFIKYTNPTKILFLGLILGSFPTLFKEIKNNNNNKLKPYYFSFSIITFILSFILILLENNYLNINNNNPFLYNNNFLYYIFSGFLMSAGIVIPGVSSTVILMLLGIYSNYINAISTINIFILFPLGIGLILGSLFFLIIIKKLMNKYYTQTFFMIFGFIFGSCIILIPNTFNINYLFILLGSFLLAKNIKK